jgi:molecular chaperone DnaJ
LKDPYQVLGVSRAATADEITKAYRKLARDNHPDRNPGDNEAENRFKEISSSYEILSDPQKRRHYDAYGDVKPRQSTQGKPFTSVMDDFFSSFFGQRRSANNELHIHAETRITLEQSYSGGEVEIRYDQQVACETCKGAGGKEEDCKHCDGTGFKVIIGEAHTVKTGCHACENKGRVVSETCPDCNGARGSFVEKTHTFKIPLGVESGMRFAHGGMGNVHPEDETLRGNLYVTVIIEEHEIFRRLPQGNLYLEVPVSYSQLVLGSEVEVPTISGKRINFKIPKGTQDGVKFRLAQQGMPIFNNGGNACHYGDQLIQVRLEVPTEIDDGYKKMVEDLSALEESNMTPARKKFIERLG